MFIARAIRSVQAQTLSDWEMVVVDDCSGDGTEEVVRRFLDDRRICNVRLDRNRGLGAALNVGLERARGEFISYLPSDDVYYEDHLQSLVSALGAASEATLAISGVRHHYNRMATGRIDGSWFQLVQALHRKTDVRWTERIELVSDDLDRLFWSKIAGPEAIVETGEVTCEWVEHPGQLHRLLQEPEGGINPFRRAFQIRHPLRFQSSQGNFIDEAALYSRFRTPQDETSEDRSLKIVLCGELAYNPERILALEERGHRLFGLWMEHPYWYNTVGPLPFGDVVDLPRDGWEQALQELNPDVIYGGFNWQAVPFLRKVLDARGNIPFVFHFKEGPFICLEKGIWADLVRLYEESDGVIFCSPEMEAWTRTAVPGMSEFKPSLVLDADLPKSDWFDQPFSSSLSSGGADRHTVVPGRPIGLHPETVAELAGQNIHLHFYGDFTHGQWKQWIERASGLAPHHLHLHPNVDQRGWVREFSKYDAGWLHYFESTNRGDIHRANWDDLNYPARMATLIAAGLPLLQFDNGDATVATDSLIRSKGMGVFFRSMPELGLRLRDDKLMEQVRANVLAHRMEFSFDHHCDRLLAFFTRIAENQREEAGSDRVPEPVG